MLVLQAPDEFEQPRYVAPVPAPLHLAFLVQIVRGDNHQELRLQPLLLLQLCERDLWDLSPLLSAQV